jgi:hypothetical protein
MMNLEGGVTKNESKTEVDVFSDEDGTTVTLNR